MPTKSYWLQFLNVNIWWLNSLVIEYLLGFRLLVVISCFKASTVYFQGELWRDFKHHKPPLTSGFVLWEQTNRVMLSTRWLWWLDKLLDVALQSFDCGFCLWSERFSNLCRQCNIMFFSKVSRIHHSFVIVWTKFHGNPSNGCFDISVWSNLVDRATAYITVASLQACC